MERNPAANCANWRLILLLGGFDFFDAGRFAAKFADVIKLRAPHSSGADYFNFVDHFRMKRKDALHTVSERNLANGEGRAGATVLLGDTNTFKYLDAFFVAFLDFDVDLDGVSRLEAREIRSYLLTLNPVYCVHICSIYLASGPLAGLPSVLTSWSPAAGSPTPKNKSGLFRSVFLSAASWRHSRTAS